MTKKATHGGARKGAGRKPHQSTPWATISVRLPLPMVEAYRALPPEERTRIAAELRAVVERRVRLE